MKCDIKWKQMVSLCVLKDRTNVMVTWAGSGLRQQRHAHQSGLFKNNVTLITPSSWSVSANVSASQSLFGVCPTVPKKLCRWKHVVRDGESMLVASPNINTNSYFSFINSWCSLPGCVHRLKIISCLGHKSCVEMTKCDWLVIESDLFTVPTTICSLYDVWFWI